MFINLFCRWNNVLKYYFHGFWVSVRPGPEGIDEIPPWENILENIPSA